MKEHWAFRYGIAVLLSGVTIAVAIALNRSGIKVSMTIPIVLTVVASAWYGGLGPGLLASAAFHITTIIYAEPPPDATIGRLVFGYFSIATVYVLIVAAVNRLHKTQSRLASQRDLLDVTLRSIGDGVIATDTDGKVSFMNEAAEELTGVRSTEAVGKKASQVLTLVDEETDEAVASPVEDVLGRTGSSSGTRRALAVARSGRRVPVEASAAPIRYRDRTEGAVVVLSDLTEQRAMERSRRKTETMRTIVDAQEAERHRIARDLHDNLGQRMSALRMRIESMTTECAEMPKIAKLIEQVQDSAARIDRDLGFLAWELKPTELGTLGLVDALRSFVRDWSLRHGIEAEFHADVPGNEDRTPKLSSEIETNLYRIAQEALSNVQKHSGAGTVNVMIQQRGDRLVLVVEDDGKGFDDAAESLESSESPLVHGLIGMKERAALLGGALEIDSTPGGGTTVIAQLPVSSRRTGPLPPVSGASAGREIETSLSPNGTANEVQALT
jgi:PAS domain S-box-containing protein